MPGPLGLVASLLALALCLTAFPAPAAPSADRQLAAELCEEGNWKACVVECRRILARDPGDAEARRLQALACAHIAPHDHGRASVLTAPVRWIIRFYRRQIAPAIGARCSLSPSCSEYTMRALRRHGLLGVAMYADRAVREPSVIAEGEHSHEVRGRRKFIDLLDDHDWWMKGSAECGIRNAE